MRRAEFFRDALPSAAGPLRGVRVLELSVAWSGPMAGCILADLGADVVRVEVPGNREGQIRPNIPGTTLSWFRETVGRNKRSIGLRIDEPAGLAVLMQLVRRSDLVVENFKPGTLDRLGAGFEACRAVRPDIVMVSISGWGQYGPDAARPGYDPVAQAASGWMALNRLPGAGGMRAPTFLADDLAALHAVIGALAALRHRDATGEGQHVDVSLLDALLFQSSGFPTLAATGAPPEPWGNETEFVVPCNTFRCLDGEVYLLVALDRHWRRLAEAIGRPELARAEGYATNDERRANRDVVNALVASFTRSRRVAEICRLLDGCGIAVSAVRGFEEAVRDPHVREREMLQEVELADGSRAPLVGPPVKFSRTPTRVRWAAPRPGADTAAVLAEAGLGAGECGRLAELGVV